jgi:Uma2 family endonuclease
MSTSVKAEQWLRTQHDPPSKHLSYEEFLAWLPDGIHAEWVDGKVIPMSPTSRRHQLISLFLSTILNVYTSTHALGQVMTAPFQMRLRALNRGREPDILFVAAANLDRITEQYVDGPADLAIEIISPESVERDRHEKFQEYAAAGVREYWLIDPQTETAEFYLLVDGAYQPVRVSEEGEFSSIVLPGLRLPVRWLWQSSELSMAEVLRSIGAM